MPRSDARERLQLDEAYSDFPERYPSYIETQALDKLRDTDDIESCRIIRDGS